MTDERPPDWDWVKATQNCKALVMFGSLRVLAERDMKARNADLNQDKFTLTDLDGIHFSVNRQGGEPAFPDRVFFQVTGDELSEITVRSSRKPGDPTIYTVGLDDDGVCRFRRDGQNLHAWQVLKAALEPLLF